MRGHHHDLGGRDEGPIDRREHPVSLYQQRADAMVMLLVGRGFYTLDEARRVAEWDLSEAEYREIPYYDRWLVQARRIMTERGHITSAEVAAAVRAARTHAAADRAAALALPVAPIHVDHGDHGDHHGHGGRDHALDDDGARPLTEYEILEEALRELFIAKGFFTAADLQATVADTESRTPALGARFVARAWTDPRFFALALDDARAAAAALGIDMAKAVPTRAIANTPGRHHIVVCSLCSCYPRPLLGPPPAWYKSRAYRARTVIDPRGVLREFGTELPATTEVRVVDSTADLRYFVIPERPAGTAGWTPERLAELVTRDSMIGVGRARDP